MDKLTKDLAEALEYVRRFVKPYDVDTDYLDGVLDQYRAQLEREEQDKQNLYP
jgi:hypothetical protein